MLQMDIFELNKKFEAIVEGHKNLGELISELESRINSALELHVIGIDPLDGYVDEVVEQLDPRSPTLRAPAQSEQKCPSCEGGIENPGSLLAARCRACNGTGISNRSDGG